ncbi:MAG: YqhA family protein [Chitinophagaceae bacterium]
MFKKLLYVRYLFLIVVIFMMLNSVFFIVGGVIESIEGIRLFITHGLDEEKKPGLKLLKGLDLFLVSIVFMIFAIGIVRLFGIYKHDDGDLPSWLNISSFKELKVLLWETILVTLVVFTLTGIATDRSGLHWEMLILPGVILILSLSLYLMRKH